VRSTTFLFTTLCSSIQNIWAKLGQTSPVRHVASRRVAPAPRRSASAPAHAVPLPRCPRAPPEDTPSEVALSPCTRAHAKDASRSASPYHRATIRGPTGVVRPRVPPSATARPSAGNLGARVPPIKRCHPTSRTGAPPVPSPCPPPEPATARSGADPPLSQAKASPPLYPNCWSSPMNPPPPRSRPSPGLVAEAATTAGHRCAHPLAAPLPDRARKLNPSRP
jgi:hypothetical protein